CARAGRGYW
nr:immunoglobulin heavy chain junction region [Mus musculus]